jgi:hypothetical protein
MRSHGKERLTDGLPFSEILWNNTRKEVRREYPIKRVSVGKLFWNFSAHSKAWKNYGNNFSG